MLYIDIIMIILLTWSSDIKLNLIVTWFKTMFPWYLLCMLVQVYTHLHMTVACKKNKTQTHVQTGILVLLYTSTFCILRYTGTYRYTQVYTGIHHVQYGQMYTSIQRYTSAYTSIYKCTPVYTGSYAVYTGIDQNTPVYTGRHQYTPVYTGVH